MAEKKTTPQPKNPNLIGSTKIKPAPQVEAPRNHVVKGKVHVHMPQGDK